jgi:hypothetical protein
MNRAQKSRNRIQLGAFALPDFPRAAVALEGGPAMWLPLFSIVTAIALACGIAAVVLESYEEARP